MPRLIVFVLCLAVLAFSASTRLGLALLATVAVLWVAYLAVLFWQILVGPAKR